MVDRKLTDGFALLDLSQKLRNRQFAAERLDVYQETAGKTNLWPRVFTEQQVREMLEEINIYLDQPWSDDEVAELLDEHTQPLNRAIYQVLGACEEVGELAGNFKKTIRDDGGQMTPEREKAVLHEDGDALWYLSQVAAAFKWPFSKVARANLDKLADREARGVLRGSGDYR